MTCKFRSRSILRCMSNSCPPPPNFVDTDKTRDPVPPEVKKIDPAGIAHVFYSFKGQGRGLLLGCPVGHASILVHFKIRSEIPVRGVSFPVAAGVEAGFETAASTCGQWFCVAWPSYINR